MDAALARICSQRGDDLSVGAQRCDREQESQKGKKMGIEGLQKGIGA